MRASAQVTAPGAVTSMIMAVSTRPDRQNRSTCSRMSVPLVQKRKLRLVNRINRRARLSLRPCHGRQDGQRHPDGKCEPSWWFRCHVPLLATLLVPVPVLVPSCRTFSGANREGCVNCFTLRIIVILMETIKDLYYQHGLRLPSAAAATCAEGVKREAPFVLR